MVLEEDDENSSTGRQAEAWAWERQTGFALTRRWRPGVDQGSVKLLLQPYLATNALHEWNEMAQCSEGTLPLDPFCNHPVVNSDAGGPRAA